MEGAVCRTRWEKKSEHQEKVRGMTRMIISEGRTPKHVQQDGKAGRGGVAGNRVGSAEDHDLWG